MGSKTEILKEKVTPLVEEENLELVDLEFSEAGPASLLRVYVDRTTGVTVDQCAALSRKISDLLDIEDLIPSRYRLEGSSPGLDRPLVNPADFKRKIGEKVKIFLKEKMDGKMEVVGKIKCIEEGNVLLEVPKSKAEEKKEEIIPLRKVAKAKIMF
jgi:ribosome maturation factor RimP